MTCGVTLKLVATALALSKGLPLLAKAGSYRRNMEAAGAWPCAVN